MRFANLSPMRFDVGAGAQRKYTVYFPAGFDFQAYAVIVSTRFLPLIFAL